MRRRAQALVDLDLSNGAFFNSRAAVAGPNRRAHPHAQAFNLSRFVGAVAFGEEDALGSSSAGGANPGRFILRNISTSRTLKWIGEGDRDPQLVGPMLRFFKCGWSTPGQFGDHAGFFGKRDDVSGEIGPRVGWFHRTSARTANLFGCGSMIGWYGPSVALDRLAKLGPNLAAFRRCASPVRRSILPRPRFGCLKREIGVRIRLSAHARPDRDRDSDRGADDSCPSIHKAERLS